MRIGKPNKEPIEVPRPIPIHVPAKPSEPIPNTPGTPLPNWVPEREPVYVPSRPMPREREFALPIPRGSQTDGILDIIKLPNNCPKCGRGLEDYWMEGQLILNCPVHNVILVTEV